MESIRTIGSARALPKAPAFAENECQKVKKVAIAALCYSALTFACIAQGLGYNSIKENGAQVLCFSLFTGGYISFTMHFRRTE